MGRSIKAEATQGDSKSETHPTISPFCDATELAVQLEHAAAILPCGADAACTPRCLGSVAGIKITQPFDGALMPRNFLAFVDLFAHDAETFTAVTQHETEVCIRITGPTTRKACFGLDHHIEILDLEPGNGYRMSSWLQRKGGIQTILVSPNCSVSFQVGEENVARGKHSGDVRASGPAYVARDGEVEGRELGIDANGLTVDDDAHEFILVVGVKTAASAFEARAAIRETWASEEHPGSRVYFIVGKPSDERRKLL